MDKTTDARVDITQGRSNEFFDVTKRLGKFIHAMDLDADTNNELIDLMCEQVRIAELDAFKFGVGMGTNLVKDYYEGNKMDKLN